jgi:hypothetical protein
MKVDANEAKKRQTPKWKQTEEQHDKLGKATEMGIRPFASNGHRGTAVVGADLFTAAHVRRRNGRRASSGAVFKLTPPAAAGGTWTETTL